MANKYVDTMWNEYLINHEGNSSFEDPMISFVVPYITINIMYPTYANEAYIAKK